MLFSCFIGLSAWYEDGSAIWWSIRRKFLAGLPIAQHVRVALFPCEVRCRPQSSPAQAPSVDRLLADAVAAFVPKGVTGIPDHTWLPNDADRAAESVSAGNDPLLDDGGKVTVDAAVSSGAALLQPSSLGEQLPHRPLDSRSGNAQHPPKLGHVDRPLGPKLAAAPDPIPTRPLGIRGSLVVLGKDDTDGVRCSGNGEGREDGHGLESGRHQSQSFVCGGTKATNGQTSAQGRTGLRNVDWGFTFGRLDHVHKLNWNDRGGRWCWRRHEWLRRGLGRQCQCSRDADQKGSENSDHVDFVEGHVGGDGTICQRISLHEGSGLSVGEE